jgi:hypothetical protein
MVCKWHLPHSVASLEGSDLVDEGSDVGHQGSADLSPKKDRRHWPKPVPAG